MTKSTLVLNAAMALTLIDVRSADATPVTWSYFGSVVSSFDNTLVPVGSLTSILLTVDPANNFVVAGPGVLPDAGAYFFDASIDFIGRHYDFHGAFEINQDFIFLEPLEGFILLRYLSLLGPKLDPADGLYGPLPLICSLGRLFPCSYLYPAAADPRTSAFPGPLPVADFTLFFAESDSHPVGVRVVGTLVPEPSSLVLLTTALIGLIRRRSCIGVHPNDQY